MPFAIPSSYNVTRVPARAVPLKVPDTDVAFSLTVAGSEPQRAEPVALAEAKVDELALSPQLPFWAFA